jgi:hypothetical protein
MRKEVIVLLAATSCVIGSGAGQARATSDLYAHKITPRMIIWNVCIAPRNGSALSIYSRTDESMRSFHDLATQDDLCVSCADYAEEARDGDTAKGSRSADPQESDPTWSACDADGIDDASGLTGKRKVQTLFPSNR